MFCEGEEMEGLKRWKMLVGAEHVGLCQREVCIFKFPCTLCALPAHQLPSDVLSCVYTQASAELCRGVKACTPFLP